MWVRRSTLKLCKKAAGEPNRADILRAEEAKIMKEREGREKGDIWQDAEKERN